jgi:hypothetical protein
MQERGVNASGIRGLTLFESMSLIQPLIELKGLAPQKRLAARTGSRNLMIPNVKLTSRIVASVTGTIREPWELV